MQATKCYGPPCKYRDNLDYCSQTACIHLAGIKKDGCVTTSLYEYLETLPNPETAEERALVAYSNMLDDISIAMAEYRMKNKLSKAQLAEKLLNAEPEISAAKCDCCAELEAGDSLYIHRSDDRGILFDEIRNVQYCPLCGSRLRRRDCSVEQEGER